LATRPLMIDPTNFIKRIHDEPMTTVITPNRRLSATLHKLYQRYQINNQLKSWDTLDALPISTWMQRLWSNFVSQTFSPQSRLLTTTQENFLWERILSESKDNSQLLQISETAELLKSAWSLFSSPTFQKFRRSSRVIPLDKRISKQ
jgi:hypothetical protein